MLRVGSDRGSNRRRDDATCVRTAKWKVKGRGRHRNDLLVRFNDSSRPEANQLPAVTQYQSFPGAAGDSQSLQKLKPLHIPALKGRSFLDVGCNEGFFCGYARFDGAERVVGID